MVTSISGGCDIHRQYLHSIISEDMDKATDRRLYNLSKTE